MAITVQVELLFYVSGEYIFLAYVRIAFPISDLDVDKALSR
jgi:hypothetical protein